LKTFTINYYNIVGIKEIARQQGAPHLRMIGNIANLKSACGRLERTAAHGGGIMEWDLMKINRKYSILAVDDESANLAVLNKILSAEYTVYTAKSGEKALLSLKTARPDLILLDVVMPDMDGFEVLAKLKSSPETQGIPVIFITGLESADDEEKGFSLGAADYIRKPFKAIVVKARVSAQMKNATRLNMVEEDLARISSITEASPQFELFMNTDGGLEYMNPAIEEISGYAKAEIAEKGLGLLLDGEELRRLNEEYVPALQGRRRFDFEMQITRKDGKRRILSAIAFVAALHGGEIGVGITARDDTELKLMQRELLEAKRRTEQALSQAEYYNKAKSDFLSRMSHEMRTPLNAIIGMTGIARSAEDAERRTYCLDRADEASHNLLDIINAVLDMAQIDTGKFKLLDREFSFKEMIGAVLGKTRPNAGAKSQNFSASIDESIPDFLVADDTRLGLILVNLLSNAVKYTPEGGSIELRAELGGVVGDEVSIRFEVSDTGVGISDEQKSRLFKAFEQADNSITREHGGTGLGLALAGSIVEMMRGEIHVESEPGKGSRFIFTVRAKKHCDSGENMTGMADLAGKKVLIVDDVELNREILLTMLEDTDAVFDCAENGSEAVSIFSEKSSDLILMDLHMPVMDGFEAARNIRSSGMPHADSVPIIAVTAEAGSDAPARCLDAGMNGYVCKPVDLGILMGAIEKAMIGSRAGQKI
jgi:PAS domain S-box-containing protein